MNRGVLQSSPVQQMMAGNPNLWSINNMRPPTPTPPPPPHHHHHHHQPSSPFLSPPIFFPQFITPPSSSSSSSTLSSSSSLSPSSWNDGQDQLPESWSQLLMGGMVGDEDKAAGSMNHFQVKKMQNWEEQILHHHQVQVAANSSAPPPPVVLDVKQENSPAASSYMYGHANEDFQQAAKPATWSPIPMVPASSPKSCVTSFSSDMLDFSSTKGDGRHPPPDRSSECNSTATGGAVKKARVQPSSTQSPMKVRKEKLGDRITALHQLVSPFGKTDTASVLLEAIGYIRFLQNQIEALSLPYLGSSGSANIRQQQQQQQQQQHSHVQGERNCVFPEDPGQLLNDKNIKRKGASETDSLEEPKKDLRSRGLCLVPVSCTLQVGSDNGADYWAPALGGGFR